MHGVSLNGMWLNGICQIEEGVEGNAFKLCRFIIPKHNIKWHILCTKKVMCFSLFRSVKINIILEKNNFNKSRQCNNDLNQFFYQVLQS